MKVLKVSTCLVLAFSMSACSVMTGDVSAKAGRTESTKVEIAKIPYDKSKPKIAIVVQPFKSSEDTIHYNFGQVNAVSLSDKMAAQLITSLSNVGNFVLFDSKSAKKKLGFKKTIIAKATLTEFNEDAESSSESKGGSLGGIGLLTGIAGAVTGNRALGWSGYGLAVANPTYGESVARRTGMVAFDVTLVDQATGQILGSHECSGTFTAEAKAAGGSLFGIGSSKTASASSALGQAIRMAMNEAVEKTVDTLLN